MKLKKVPVVREKKEGKSLHASDIYNLCLLPRNHAQWPKMSSKTISYISSMMKYETNKFLRDETHQNENDANLLKELQQRVLMKLKGTKAPSSLFDYNMASLTLSSLDESVSNLKDKITFLFEALESEKDKVKKLKERSKSEVCQQK